jgi:hypothetical protein
MSSREQRSQDLLRYPFSKPRLSDKSKNQSHLEQHVYKSSRPGTDICNETLISLTKKSVSLSVAIFIDGRWVTKPPCHETTGFIQGHVNCNTESKLDDARLILQGRKDRGESWRKWNVPFRKESRR